VRTAVPAYSPLRDYLVRGEVVASIERFHRRRREVGVYWEEDVAMLSVSSPVSGLIQQEQIREQRPDVD
jgi:hypothetical protein